MQLQQARKFALSLPETTEEPHFEYSSFRVRGKIFATVPPDGTVLHIFVDEDQRGPLITIYPEAYTPLNWGKRVVGIRVLLAPSSAEKVKLLLTQSWLRKAPKQLAATLGAQRQ